MFHTLIKPGHFGQWIAAFAVCLLFMTCGQAFSWPSCAIPKIRSGDPGFILNEDEESWMVTLSFIGNLVSPIPAGYIMDLIGRKNSLLLFILMAIASWIIIFFSYTALGLYIARFLIGLWAGFVYTVSPVYVGEIATPKARGIAGATLAAMYYVGGIFESISGLYFNYETLVLISLLPPVLLFIFLLFLPESPYFHLMKGRRNEAIKSLNWLRGTCDLSQLDIMESFVQEQLKNAGGFLDLVKTKVSRKSFMIVELLGILQRCSGLMVIVSYLSLFLPDSWLSAQQSFPVVCFSLVMGSVITSVFLRNFGRRSVLIISASGSCVTMALFSLWLYLRDFTNIDTSSTESFPFIIIIINGVFYSAGFSFIPTVVQSELFPVNVKGKASAITIIVMSFFSAISVRIYQPITRYIGLYFNFVICAIACALCVIFAATIMVETHGKSLEQIQEMLTQKKTKKEKEAYSIE